MNGVVQPTGKSESLSEKRRNDFIKIYQVKPLTISIRGIFFSTSRKRKKFFYLPNRKLSHLSSE